MTVQVSLSSELKVEPGELTAGIILPWLSALPSDAKITPKTRQVGNQRDYYDVCVGLRAEWTEERGTGAIL